PSASPVASQRKVGRAAAGQCGGVQPASDDGRSSRCQVGPRGVPRLPHAAWRAGLHRLPGFGYPGLSLFELVESAARHAIKMRKLLTRGGERVVLVALAVAAVALAVRLSLSHFPVGGHQDEAIVATLSMRSRESGHISVNWDGFPGTFWSKPSLQFSPHTLLQTGVDSISRPVGLASHIRTARGTSIACGTLAVLFAVLVSWELFGTLLGATLAGLVLALSLLHAHDRVY